MSCRSARRWRTSCRRSRPRRCVPWGQTAWQDRGQGLGRTSKDGRFSWQVSSQATALPPAGVWPPGSRRLACQSLAPPCDHPRRAVAAGAGAGLQQQPAGQVRGLGSLSECASHMASAVGPCTAQEGRGSPSTAAAMRWCCCGMHAAVCQARTLTTPWLLNRARCRPVSSHTAAVQDQEQYWARSEPYKFQPVSVFADAFAATPQGRANLAAAGRAAIHRRQGRRAGPPGAHQVRALALGGQS